MTKICIAFAILVLNFIDGSRSSNISFSLKNVENFRKFNLTEENHLSILRVLAKNNAPFFYQRCTGKSDSGFELKLIKTIVEKENLNVYIEFQSQIDPTDVNQLLTK